MLDPELCQRIEDALGFRVNHSQSVSGGDINQAMRLDTSEGVFFAKFHQRPPTGMFSVEAQGLEWLRAGKSSLRIPEVIAVGDDFLVLEWVTSVAGGAVFEETLGHGLAELHRSYDGNCGWESGNFIGRLPQTNPWTDDWSSFYWDARLAPQVKKAQGAFSKETLRKFEKLRSRLEQLVGPEEAPARLHGDLWGGNMMCSERGPTLIDPAVYAGHREIDLAMMKLFGGFGQRVFDAYDEAYPLGSGWENRIPLYQLYPLLVHVNLFGGGYVGSVEGALDRVLGQS